MKNPRTWPACQALFLTLVVMFTFSAASFGAQPDRLSGHLKWKMVWLWSMGDKSDAEVVSLAKSLGFNAIQARSPQMAEECRKQGMQAFGLLAFGNPPAEYRQVVSPEEARKISADQKKTPFGYQYGGQPLMKGELFFEDEIWCFDRPEALQYGKSMIDKLISEGYDGIALDYIGFRNYHACCCPVSLSAQAKYRKAHPKLSRRQAVERYSQESLVSFYKSLADYARSRKPGIVLTAHIYPYFAPNPLYGGRVPVDYCGQTVSWFFNPHWSLGKVRKYARTVVDDSMRRRRNVGTPFIGIYTLPPYSEHRKTAERVRQEIRIIKASGSQAIQIAELGNVLNDPAVAQVVREELGTVPDNR